ncbi:hypothetical protein ACFOPQ_08145 [Deinococcus antarcticus]|uniref:Uncharacterized protein n=1 Tax=Deinococcus antarcticus TaxID=1298767 RepID=A0ABV8A975_9DEIO
MNYFFTKDLRNISTKEDLDRFCNFEFFIDEKEEYEGVPLVSKVEIANIENGYIYANRYRCISDDWEEDEDGLSRGQVEDAIGDLDESDDYYITERPAVTYIKENLDLLQSQVMLTIATVNGDAPELIDALAYDDWGWYNLSLLLADKSRYIPAAFREALVNSRKYQNALWFSLQEAGLEERDWDYTPTNAAFRTARSIAEAAGNAEAVALIDRKFAHRLVKVDDEELFSEEEAQ